MKRVAIIGASGYTGREVLRLVRSHPEMQADLVMTARPDTMPAPPDLPYDPIIDPLELDKLRYVDGAFLCTPHGPAAAVARAALERECKVVDLSADFRLRDPDVYKATYGDDHPAPDLLEQAVYGLTEHARQQVAGARLVANPGCYPTSILLPLLPLIDHGLVQLRPGVVADSKSGLSGAGKTPTDRNVFGSVHENFLAYKVGEHRHAPEIWQAAGTDRIAFVPHLLPVFRGILSTIYVRPRDGHGAADLLACLEEAYAAEPFVRLYTRGQPELNRVQHTNYCDIAVTSGHADLVVITSAIDNLVKGAAGQAVQNMNVLLGLDETAGLLP